MLAVGRPGQKAQAMLGIVSALGESWCTPTGGLLDRYVQTDVVMFPGFSGGPLVNAAGHVLGLNTSALLRGLSLTVSISTLRRVVDIGCGRGQKLLGFADDYEITAVDLGANLAHLHPGLAAGHDLEVALDPEQALEPVQDDRLGIGDDKADCHSHAYAA